MHVFHEGDLDVLTALLAESEGAGEEVVAEGQGADPDQQEDFDSLFDGDSDEEEFREGLSEGLSEGERPAGAGDELSDLFGDVDDIEIEEEAKENDNKEEASTLNKSREDLQGLCLCFSPQKYKNVDVENVEMKLPVLRGAEADAGTDAAVAAAAGSLPEELGRPPTEQGRPERRVREDGRPGRYKAPVQRSLNPQRPQILKETCFRFSDVFITSGQRWKRQRVARVRP